MDTDNSVVSPRGGELRELEEGVGRQMVMGGDLTWSEHTTQCTDEVLWNFAPGTCIIVLTSVTPIHSMKRKNI